MFMGKLETFTSKQARQILALWHVTRLYHKHYLNAKNNKLSPLKALLKQQNTLTLQLTRISSCFINSHDNTYEIRQDASSRPINSYQSEVRERVETNKQIKIRIKQAHQF